MTRGRTHLPRAHAALGVVAIALVAMLALAGNAAAESELLVPHGKRIWFGVSDTGNPANFGEFSSAVDKHPAVIESFRAWGSEVPDSIRRWQTARARPMVHLTTADPGDGHEVITLAGIAAGRGDEFLIRLNRLFASKHIRAYIRPLGEPNRCLNVYAAYDCAGAATGPADSARNYRRAFRRIYVIAHGGGKRSTIDARLREAGLPPLNSTVGGLPRAPIAVVWSPLPSGSPTTKRNLPPNYYPGDEWVDWSGTDFYAAYPEWGALTRLYRQHPDKPFALTEWGVESGDDPAFVSRLFDWVEAHPRCKMLVYYQDFGSTSNYRIQNYSASLAVLKERLHSGLFPAYAPKPPTLPPPPPGGVGLGP